MSEYDDAVKRYEVLSYKDLALEFQALKQIKADAKLEAALVEEKFDALTKQVIPDKMTEEGIKTIAIDGVGRLQLSAQAYCSTKAGMKDALFDWLIENDFKDLITDVVNASTLKAFIKEQLNLGEKVPPDEIINYDPYLRASVVKG